MKPSTQPWPDCAMRDALGLGAGDCALRSGARVVDPAAVGSDDGSGKLVRRDQRGRAASRGPTQSAA